MERQLQRVSLADWLRLSLACRRDGRRRRGRDFATVLMVAAVAGMLCQIVGTAIDLGRSAGWWQ